MFLLFSPYFSFCPTGRTIGDGMSASASLISVFGLDDDEYATDA